MWKKVDIACKLYSCDKLIYLIAQLYVMVLVFWIFAFAIDPFGTHCPMQTLFLLLLGAYAKF